MPKYVKRIAVAALLAAAVALPGAAQARWHHHWHGGGGWGPGFALGFGWGGYPYYAPYYAQPACGWTRYRTWYHGRWVLRRAWRCY